MADSNINCLVNSNSYCIATVTVTVPSQLPSDGTVTVVTSAVTKMQLVTQLRKLLNSSIYRNLYIKSSV